MVVRSLFLFSRFCFYYYTVATTALLHAGTALLLPSSCGAQQLRCFLGADLYYPYERQRISLSYRVGESDNWLVDQNCIIESQQVATENTR